EVSRAWNWVAVSLSLFDWAAACELNIKLAHIETRRAKAVIQVMAGACDFLLIFFIAVKPVTSEPPAAFRLGPCLVRRSLFVGGTKPASYCRCHWRGTRLWNCSASRLVKERASREFPPALRLVRGSCQRC